MRLYSDELVKIDYSKPQGMLYAAWAERRPYAAEEVKKAFMAIVACAREHHHVQCLLLNFADNVKDLTDAEYKATLSQLVVGLLPTATQRIACVGTDSLVRKQLIMSSFREIKEALGLPLDFRFFSKKVEAVQWLTH